MGEFQGNRFFAGSLAEDESEFPRQMLVDTKVTQDALLLGLIGLHTAGISNADIVTGVPVDQHDEATKTAFKDLLLGRWELELNGILRHINVNSVRVAVEGGGAFWSVPKDGIIRIVDGGSKTINCITIKNRRYNDRESFTLDFGFDTNKSTDAEQLVLRIVGELGKKWKSNDEVYTVGGEAATLARHLKPYFVKAEPYHKERFVSIGTDQVDINLLATAWGYHEIGSAVNV
jgi:plasmid segregation protein ParM